MKTTKQKTHFLEKLFYPESLAIIGVSPSETNLARNIYLNHKNYGYKGRLYLVGRHGGELDGHKIYTSVSEIEDTIDTATILIPNKFIPDVIDELGRKGAKVVHIGSGGYSEFAPDRKHLETELLAVLRRNQMRLVGPNCLGIMCRETGVAFPFGGLEPVKLGGVSLIAQSGGMGLSFLQFVERGNLGINKFISLGNKLDLDEADFLEYLIQDDSTTVICAYLEGFKRARRFIELASASSKPVIIIKSNRYQESSSIAQSHTTALTSDSRVFEAASRQANILLTYQLREAADICKIFYFAPIKGNRLAVLSRSGGHAVMAADHCIDSGFTMPRYPDELIELVLKGGRAGVIRSDNPMDLGDVFNVEVYKRALTCAMELPGYDGVYFVYSDSSSSAPADPSLIAHIEAINRTSTKPLFFTCSPWEHQLPPMKEQSDLPIFTTVDETLQVMGRARNYYERKSTAQIRPLEPAIPNVYLNELVGSLDEGSQLFHHETFKLLCDYEIPIAAYHVVRDAKEAVRAAEAIGYPVVLKVLSKDIVHKADVGGVKVGLSGEQAVRQAIQDIEATVAKLPTTPRIDGYLVQTMAEQGQEFFIGAKQDKEFGPVVLVGLGGIFVEVFDDVALRLAPVSEPIANEMLEELKGSKLLKGVRGRPAADVDSLVEVIVKLSQLIADNPQVQELDINPLIVYPAKQGVLAVDGRMIVGK